ncbi:MAG TPA: amidophosphoribosyltransferase [Anaeromyxobacteraceae bacterium]|nr:amidophosphoribosyltransferase [Anaeromyxobacteraceae bacterium]
MGYDAVYDKLKDECGVFGIWGLDTGGEAANFTYLGLHALQHRGQESAGIVSCDGRRVLHVHRGMGLVADIFTAEVLASLPGTAAIGHVRYSTAGASHLKNAQPIAIQYAGGAVSVAHNGNLVNADALRRELEAQGSIFQTTSDTEVILHLMARVEPERPGTSATDEHVGAIRAALQRVSGAYSLLFLTEHAMIGVRDPHGFRPLVVGKLKGSFVLASETTALDLIEAEYLREVEPGEVVVVDGRGLSSERLEPGAPPRRLARCIFEQIYFARPDSTLFGRQVHEVRSAFGAQLARDHPASADVVIAVPDSGVPAALGYSRASGIPFDVGLVRSHYIGRTFIEPQQSIRHFGVKLKLNAVRSVLEGRRVVVVDDSIVRGTTSRKIVKMVRAAGAREVHLRVSSPPTGWPCYYGIDTPTRQELIAASHDVAEIARYVTADSLGYLSVEGMYLALGESRQGYCDACFTGDYLLKFPASRAVSRRLVGG